MLPKSRPTWKLDSPPGWHKTQLGSTTDADNCLDHWKISNIRSEQVFFLIMGSLHAFNKVFFLMSSLSDCLVFSTLEPFFPPRKPETWWPNTVTTFGVRHQQDTLDWATERHIKCQSAPASKLSISLHALRAGHPLYHGCVSLQP